MQGWLRPRTGPEYGLSCRWLWPGLAACIHTYIIHTQTTCLHLQGREQGQGAASLHALPTFSRAWVAVWAVGRGTLRSLEGAEGTGAGWMDGDSRRTQI